jgi:hypothetical protein
MANRECRACLQITISFCSIKKLSYNDALKVPALFLSISLVESPVLAAQQVCLLVLRNFVIIHAPLVSGEFFCPLPVWSVTSNEFDGSRFASVFPLSAISTLSCKIRIWKKTSAVVSFFLQLVKHRIDGADFVISCDII